MIKRHGNTKDKFTYTHNSKVMKNESMLQYITSLAIPPSYKDVIIFYQTRGEPKILYQGYDLKGRLQRIYSKNWVVKARKKRFCDILYLSEQIPNITTESKKHITGPPSKDKMISMIISLIMTCYFRVGNKRYQELYGTFGAMNIQKKHISIKDNILHISFLGKKSIVNNCDITDKVLINEMRKLISQREKANDFIFQYEHKGSLVPIKAIDVNYWLNKFDKRITSKDFRTYDANILLIIHLRKYGIVVSKVQRKHKMVEALTDVSAYIHNTPSILRNNYVADGIVDMYMNDPMKFSRYFLNNKPPRVVFIEYLKDYCS